MSKKKTKWWQNILETNPTTLEAGSYGFGQMSKTNCHDGNVLIMAGKDGGGLYAGGWGRGASIADVVVDLTGNATPYRLDVKEYGSGRFSALINEVHAKVGIDWLSWPIKDYGTPVYNITEWRMLAEILSEAISDGKKVIVACQGGHGRTGMAVSILAYMMGKWEGENPVHELRKAYCDFAVETKAQEKYVYEVLGLPFEVDESQYKTYTTATQPALTNSVVTWSYCKKCKKTAKFTGKNVVCDDCSKVGMPFVKSEVAEPCPLCGKESDLILHYGLCQECMDSYKDTPLLKNDEICPCKDGNCPGITKAFCGHVVHGQFAASSIDVCDACYSQAVENLSAWS